MKRGVFVANFAVMLLAPSHENEIEENSRYSLHD